MSWWQRLQESDSMKNLLGIFWLPYTCAELGKNGPFGPSPSPSIDAGGIMGFSMRARFCQRALRRYQAPAPALAMTAHTTATRARDGNSLELFPLRSATRIPIPASDRTMCA